MYLFLKEKNVNRNKLRCIYCVVAFLATNLGFCLLQAFAKMFKSTPDDLDMHVIYDVSHNIAKVEEHYIDGRQKTLLVHRKGSTRAFPPHHPLIPVDYQVGSVSSWLGPAVSSVLVI